MNEERWSRGDGIRRIASIWHLRVAMNARLVVSTLALFTILGFAIPLPAQTKQSPITGQDAFADWSQEKPGILRKISVTDLPEPKPAESVRNQPHIVPRPQNAWPIAPAGFKVTLYAGGDNGPSSSPDQQHSQQHRTKPPDKGTFRQPRLIRAAPNGDLFVCRLRRRHHLCSERHGSGWQS